MLLLAALRPFTVCEPLLDTWPSAAAAAQVLDNVDIKERLYHVVELLDVCGPAGDRGESMLSDRNIGAHSAEHP